MSLKHFLYACDALRLEDGLEFVVEGERAVPSPADNRKRNADSMAALQAMMGGVQKRGRRR